MKRCLVLAIVIAGVWSASALAEDKPPAGVDPAKALTEMQQQFLQQFDINKDGKLSDQEKLMAQEAMQRQGWNLGIAPSGLPGADQFVKQFDADRDGKLSPMEAAAAQAAFQRMRGGNGMRGGIRGGGSGGAIPPQPAAPVAPAPEQKKGKVPPLVKRFDKDGDGKLNAEEKAAAQAELKKDKSKDKDKDVKPKEKAEKKGK
jgi:hypothetical protein